MPEKGEKSLSGAVSGLAENTGMHGLPNIYRSKSICRKSAWIIILLAGLAFMVWQLEKAFRKYYSYPSDTNIGTGTKTSVEFPAVSICNLNPIRLSELGNAGPEFSAQFGTQANEDGSGEWDMESTGRPPTFFSWDTQTNNANYFEREDSEFSQMETFLELTSELQINQLVQYGHQIDWMLLDCSFMGKECSPRNFTRFYNTVYGNCYTFNAGDQNTTLLVSKVGPMYGLTLKLFVQQDEYVPGLADAAGIRVVVHNKSDMPFPEDEGFSLAPGTLTYVGLERIEIYREDPPHGDCEDVDDDDNKIKNLWRSQFYWLNYTSQACKKTCYQLHVIERCNCSDSDFPNSGTAVDYVTGQTDTKVRPCKSDDEETCKDSVSSLFQMGKLNCTDHCKKECLSVNYNRHQSHARWPSEAKENDELESLYQRDEELYEKLRKEPTPSNYLRKNILKMKIYFKTLDYTAIVTKASYGIVDLLSDIGGQVGLWLGLSVITVFEFIELIWDICTICVDHNKANKVSGPNGGPDQRQHQPDAGGIYWSSTAKLDLGRGVDARPPSSKELYE